MSRAGVRAASSYQELCAAFSIRRPIFAFSRSHAVVAAVTAGGGFGVLGATQHAPDDLERALRYIDERVGDAPYGVDLVLPARHAGIGSDDVDPYSLLPQEHRAFVEDLLGQHGISPLADGEAGPWQGVPGRIDGFGAAELLDVCFAHPVALVASALGAPPPDLVERAREHDVPVAGLAGSVAHAAHHLEAGVDILIAQGTEAAGHTGEVGTMVLVPEVVDLSPVPVLAAGGIVDGRQIAASVALGAVGVWTGSLWLVTDEAETTAVTKAKLIAGSAGDTVRSRSITGKPARQIKSGWTAAWADPAHPDPLPMPLQILLVADAHERIVRAAARGDAAAAELEPYFAGQGIGFLKHQRPAGEALESLIAEFDRAMDRLAVVGTADIGAARRPSAAR